ncbi:phage major capsid protein [Bremerella sp. T1]|uniref:phage major capsid protein n=1 Tax=Bremerella sp. TYQ1 TaxID=3119568 RepID=UPI001CCBC430|nr:phage major capsid protein [Bremerella volcania]UBM37370.1 phage major capsid protein [Bremerella volcania]
MGFHNKGEIIAQQPKNHFKNPGEFLDSVRKATLNPKSKDARLNGFEKVGVQAAGSDEHGVYSDPRGGFTMPTEWSPSIQSLDFDDPTSPFVRVIQTDAYRVRVPARFEMSGRDTSSTGGITVGRRAETQPDEPTRGQFFSIELEPSYLGALSFASDRLVSSSTPDFQQLLATAIQEEIGWATLDDRLNGTGAGQPTGVVDSPCTIEVEKESMQPADTITGNNIIDMASRCWNYQDAIWLANHDCLPQISQAHIVGTNSDEFLFKPAQGVRAVGLLHGRPLILTEFCQTLGNRGDIVLGNWREYLVAINGGFRGEASIHVRFVESQTAFRFWIEIDSTPWWLSTLTPKYGANTLSPFVTLEAR